MEKVLNYVLYSLHSSEKTLNGIVKTLRHQNAINRRFTIFVAIASINMIQMNIHRKEQEKRIAELEQELKEYLDELKGE